MSNEEEIRQLITEQAEAIRKKDIEAAMAQYAKDIVSFDVIDSLQKKGKEACRERLETWLSQFPGPFSYEIEQLAVVSGEDIAYCHSMNHVKGARATGEVIDMRWRATVCYSKTGGVWLITHEHSSVPFDADSGKALTSLST